GTLTTPKSREQANIRIAKNRVAELRENPHFVDLEGSLDHEMNDRSPSFEQQVISAGAHIVDSPTVPASLPPVRGNASAAGLVFSHRRTTAGLKEEELRDLVVGSNDFGLDATLLEAIRKHLGAWQIQTIRGTNGEPVSFSSWPGIDDEAQHVPSNINASDHLPIHKRPFRKAIED
ncbi:MAG: hypothetical protein Q8P67_08500, partial [archaeon]|nr:hypothetical protein [archaeon]